MYDRYRHSGRSLHVIQTFGMGIRSNAIDLHVRWVQKLARGTGIWGFLPGLGCRKEYIPADSANDWSYSCSLADELPQEAPNV